MTGSQVGIVHHINIRKSKLLKSAVKQTQDLLHPLVYWLAMNVSKEYAVQGAILFTMPLLSCFADNTVK